MLDGEKSMIGRSLAIHELEDKCDGTTTGKILYSCVVGIGFSEEVNTAEFLSYELDTTPFSASCIMQDVNLTFTQEPYSKFMAITFDDSLLKQVTLSSLISPLHHTKTYFLPSRRIRFTFNKVVSTHLKRIN